MFKVKIYTIGRLKDAWLQEALAEYEKRLSRQMQLEWILAKNDEELLHKIEQETSWVALDVQGESIDSVRFSKKIWKLFESGGSRLNFLIGGAEGIEKKLLEKSIWRWSLSPLTFTHQIVRLLLLEQLYRASEIMAGSSYHK